MAASTSPRGFRLSLPFGLDQTKPRHFRDMLGIAWENRDNLGYAWKVLSQGVCDGCALGTTGLHDWTIPGTHLCMTRLNLLRLNTMGPLDHDRLADVAPLKTMSNRQLRKMGRLAYPMLRESGDQSFRRITWDEAINRIAERIRLTDPKRLALYLTSRGITNETYYVAQKVARLLGTNNVDNAARLCHSPSTAAMKHALGVGASTCSYRDWFGTDLVVFFGSNPANDQPVAMKYLHKAKKLGTRVVLVNPYHEPGMRRYWVPSEADSAVFGTDIADEWFAVTQGGDIAFLTGVCALMIENGWHSPGFIAEHTEGFDDLKAAVTSAAMDWPRLEREAGLPRSAMMKFAEMLRDADTAVFVWSMGITQHVNGSDAVQMILNLGLLKGYIGREHCGMMPIRGHSGVQGGAEMGAYATVFPGGKPITPGNAADLSREYGFDVPGERGMDTVAMVNAAAAGELDVLYSVGGNFLRALPDPDFVENAMRRVPMRIHQDIILTDQMFIDAPEDGAVLLLPAATRYEQEGGGTETTTERRVIFSPHLPRQVGEARSEWRILRDVAAAVKPEAMATFGCDTGQQIRDEIARVIPFYDGIQHLHKTGDSFQWGGPRLCEGGVCPTPDGKAHFRAVALPGAELKADEFRVSTRRGKQFNTLVYAEVDPLTGAGRDAVLMSEADAGRLGLHHGDAVTLSSNGAQFRGRVFIAPIAPGNLQVHWPEGNVLLPRGICDPGGGVPDYNATVRVQRR